MLDTAEHAEGNSLSFITPPADSVRPMARRASSGTGIGPILLVALIALLVGGGGFWLFKQASDPFRTLQPLEVSAYLDNANSLRGNVYKIEVTILVEVHGQQELPPPFLRTERFPVKCLSRPNERIDASPGKAEEQVWLSVPVDIGHHGRLIGAGVKHVFSKADIAGALRESQG